ncbi:hypothetical protein AM1_2880 [Acaryochloris marina MBIC11017]|uniref:Uncharacterized protein n=1 Tax=Acaryochloris marina (strain MBIC 11017) TaxID=329726 RepID=B0CAE4_ACAM1|nr:hypothetical protein AM1_2880 [Acaryochloris marina MBIC11017]
MANSGNGLLIKNGQHADTKLTDTIRGSKEPNFFSKRPPIRQ